MKTLIALMVFLSGCSTIPVEKVEEIVDKGVEKSEAVLCEHTSVRSILKRYSGDRLESWMNFCYPDMDKARELFK